MAVEQVESWWNGSWSTLWGRRAYLERDGDRWRVRATEGRREAASDWGTEEQARAKLAELVALGDEWAQLR